MNRWSRIVWSLALAATIAWIGAGLFGYRVVNEGSLIVHSLLSFVALLGLLLSHGWIATFGVVSVHSLRRLDRDADMRGLLTARNRIVAAAVASMVAALLLFTVSNALFPARLAPRAHALTGGVSALVLLLGLWIEGRALRRHEREIRALEGGRGSGAC